ncbi:MAG: HAD hydrolase family protein [Pseudomonadales bacterium]|nr:HAD hydrolase family protein [Pseudomonadales bacterium]
MQFNQDQSEVIESAQKIELLLLDVDGVMTDGRLYFSNAGEELKAFHTLDGHGIKMLKNTGVDVGIITGRTSKIVEHRAHNLGIDLLYQGREDKLQALQEILADKGMSLDQVAYAGDDLPDLPAIQQAGLGFSVANGHADVRLAAAAVTTSFGGSGAVREITDFLLKSRNK